MAERKKPTSFSDLAKSLKASADASLGYISKDDVITVIPTGSVVLDKLSGKGGIPVGRITQMASEPGVGKSTSALTIAASCQRLGGTVLYLDFEQSLTAEYIEKMGCSLDDATMIFAQPTDIEAGWDLIDQVSNLGVNLVILDSLASMFPRVDDEAFAKLTSSIGFQAKGLSLFIPRLKTLSRVKGFAVLMINQVRAKISMNFADRFSKSPAYSMELPGGFIPKFYTDLLFYLSLRKTERETKDTAYTGTEIVVTTWKNKIGIPFGKVNMYLEFGKGINDFRSVIELGIENSIIDLKRGGFWTIPSQGDFPGIVSGEAILSGRGENTIGEQLAVNPAVYEYVRSKVLSIDFIRESVDSEEAAGIQKMLADENPSSPMPIRDAYPTPMIPAPALLPPPLPPNITFVQAADEDVDSDSPTVKRGRPKKA